VDILSEVLNAVRLTGAVFLDLELCEQWSYLTAPARKIADVLMPEADHVIPYHLVSEGTCYARLVDGDPVELHPGDLILFPQGDRHVLVAGRPAALRLKPVDITGECLGQLMKGEIAEFKKAGTGKATRIVCGFLACDKRLAEPIILSLPRLYKVRLRDGGTAAWVQSSIRYSVAESLSSRPGSAVVLARLSEVLFAEAVRQYMDEQPPGQAGWLAGLRDRYVGRTLALLHSQTGAPMDRGDACEKGRALAFRAGRALRRADRRATDAIPHALADLARRRAIARKQCADHPGGHAGRLRIRSGGQPRVQARTRTTTRCLAQARRALGSARRCVHRGFKAAPSACAAGEP